VFHYLARALITSGEFVLVARQIGAANTFLPGGHIEFREPARAALRREIYEETGLSPEVGAFLGAVEATWEEDGRAQAEINLVFAAELSGADASSAIESRESHLEFHWIAISEAEAWNLLPVPMRELLRNRASLSAFWASELES
jgi:8-oxo-dGTP pyrophosphatase MutT (NUDIX family)